MSDLTGKLFFFQINLLSLRHKTKLKQRIIYNLIKNTSNKAFN